MPAASMGARAAAPLAGLARGPAKLPDCRVVEEVSPTLSSLSVEGRPSTKGVPYTSSTVRTIEPGEGDSGRPARLNSRRLWQASAGSCRRSHLNRSGSSTDAVAGCAFRSKRLTSRCALACDSTRVPSRLPLGFVARAASGVGEVLASSISWNGNALTLVRERVSEPGSGLRIVEHDGERQVRLTSLTGEVSRDPIIQSFPGGDLLVVDRRCATSPDGLPESNARVYGPAGEIRRAWHRARPGR
jgi:hypothetical protein